ncbi:MAG TPA: NAD(+)/NADH kinase [Polyangia bacterium]|jgi:NAD+ kinase
MEPILVVYKKSTLEIYSNSPDAEVREYLAGDAPDVEVMRRSHDAQACALAAVHEALDRRGLRYDSIYRGELQPVRGRALVIALGGDGTFLEVSHFVGADTPLCGVNTDPRTSTGFFCAATADTFAALLDRLGETPRTVVRRIEAVLDGRPLPEPALNDVLFAHASPASTSRYRLDVGGLRTEHKDSGLLACSAAGSTAWMYQEGGEVMPLGSDELQYLPRGVRGARPRYCRELRLRSLTRQGRLFLDGPHIVHDCALGAEVVLRQGPTLTIIGDVAARRTVYG